MKDINHDYFEGFEIEHDFRTYYANGYIEYNNIMGIGGSYEGYDFEIIYDKEIVDIAITDLWYFDEETGNEVDILYQEEYADVEELVKEEVRYRFE